MRRETLLPRLAASTRTHSATVSSIVMVTFSYGSVYTNFVVHEVRATNHLSAPTARQGHHQPLKYREKLAYSALSISASSY